MAKKKGKPKVEASKKTGIAVVAKKEPAARKPRKATAIAPAAPRVLCARAFLKTDLCVWFFYVRC
jgi:hypothetical protein